MEVSDMKVDLGIVKIIGLLTTVLLFAYYLYHTKPNAGRAKYILFTAINLLILGSMLLLILNPYRTSKRNLQQLKQSNHVFFIIDISDSMLVKDEGELRRLERAKQIAIDIANNSEASFGLISYSTSPFFDYPPGDESFPIESLLGSLLPLGGGRDYGNKSVSTPALKVALNYYKKSRKYYANVSNYQQSIVLISDGEEYPAPDSAEKQTLQELSSLNIAVHTVTVGKESGGKVPDYTRGVATDGTYTRTNELKYSNEDYGVVSKADPTHMSQISSSTGGLSANSTDYSKVVKYLNGNQNSSASSKIEERIVKHHYVYLISVAIILLLGVRLWLSVGTMIHWAPAQGQGG
jgi:hypothetical protein